MQYINITKFLKFITITYGSKELTEEEIEEKVEKSMKDFEESLEISNEIPDGKLNKDFEPDIPDIPEK